MPACNTGSRLSFGPPNQHMKEINLWLVRSNETLMAFSKIPEAFRNNRGSYTIHLSCKLQHPCSSSQFGSTRPKRCPLPESHSTDTKLIALSSLQPLLEAASCRQRNHLHKKEPLSRGLNVSAYTRQGFFRCTKRTFIHGKVFTRSSPN